MAADFGNASKKVTCLGSAYCYEKNDLNTSDMHPFIHPLTGAVDPVWEARSDWEIYKAIAKKFSEVAPEVLGVEKDVVLTPILHDTPAEIAQALDVKDWKRGECEPVAGKTMPTVPWSSATTPTSTSASRRLGHSCRSLATAARAWPGTPSTRSTS